MEWGANPFIVGSNHDDCPLIIGAYLQVACKILNCAPYIVHLRSG